MGVLCIVRGCLAIATHHFAIVLGVSQVYATKMYASTKSFPLNENG
jgi:hypothetical protein